MSNSSMPMALLTMHVGGTELTENEKRVLRLIAMGYTQVEAAEKLERSLETIRSTTKVARARLGAKTLAHAIAIAVSLDLI